MTERLVLPVVLHGGERRFHDPSIARLPEWLDALAADMEIREQTADLYMQEIAGLRHWAEVLCQLLAQATPLAG